MEAREEGAQVALALRVPGFLGYTPQNQTVVTCDHVVRVGGITAKFRISLNLYATRRVKTWSAQHLGETTPGRATNSPTRGNGFNSFPTTSTKTPVAGRNAFSPASLKGLKGFQPEKPQCLRNTPTSSRSTPNPCSVSDSPRTKSGLRDLYTYGGIAEVIYSREDDREVPTIGSKNTTHQHKVWGGGQEETTCSDDGDQLDVCVEVVCLHSTAPWQLLRHVQIRTSIEDRPEQNRDLAYDCGPTSGPEHPVSRWRGVLVPRISLKSYGLLRGGALNASVIFNLPSEVLHSSSDTLLSLTDDMRHLLESCQTSADALLVTSDGGRVPAHLAILKARSSLLSTCTILNQTTCDIGIMVDGRSPVARSGGTGVSSTGGQRYVGNDDLRKKTAFKVSDREENAGNNSVNLSSEFSSNSDSDEDRIPDNSIQSPKPNKMIPQDFKNSPVKISSAFTRHAGFSSPSKLTSSERLALFRKVEKTPTPVARSPFARINQHRSSPSKMTVKSQNLNSKLKKATRDLNECFIDGSETSDVSLTSTLTLKTNDSVFPADDTTVLNIENDLKENFNNMNIQHNFTSSDQKKVNTVPKPTEDGRILIKVHMSTSVTKHFLEWIYTGQCRSLPTMCRPLLAAGRRHGVQELAAAAERHLVAGLSTSTAAATLLLAHTYQAWHLLQEALAFVKDHAEEVTQTEDWERVVNKCPDLALKLTRMMTSI